MGAVKQGKYNKTIRLKLGGALAAGGICLLCGFFSAGMFSEPKAQAPSPLARVTGASEAVRIDAPEGTPGMIESCGALIARQPADRDLEILLDILEQTEIA